MNNIFVRDNGDSLININEVAWINISDNHVNDEYKYKVYFKNGKDYDKYPLLSQKEFDRLKKQLHIK